MSTQTAPAENSTSGVKPVAPWRVKAVSVLPDYQLAVTFQDGLSGTVDCSNILLAADPGVFAPLTSPEYFARVELILGAPTWPNGADLDPFWVHEEIMRKKTWSVPF